MGTGHRLKTSDTIKTGSTTPSTFLGSENQFPPLFDPPYASRSGSGTGPRTDETHESCSCP